MDEVNVIVVVDADNIMRPRAGIWIDDDAGKINADAYFEKNKKHGDSIIKAKLTRS